MGKSQQMELACDDNGGIYVAMKDHAVMVIALTIDNEILFIEEKSVAYQIPVLTLPTGRIDKNELPEVSADRELQNEVGYQAETLTYIGTLNPSIKYMQWQCHIYVATNLIRSEKDSDKISSMTIQAITLEDFDRAIMSKQITDSTTIAAIYLARKYI